MNRESSTSTAIGLMVLLLCCCNGHRGKTAAGSIFDETNLSEGERMILAASAEYDFDRMTALSDSLLKTGDISAVAANYYHGVALMHNGMMGEARQHLEKAAADSAVDADDIRLNLRAKSVLARVLTTEGKYEEALTQALPALTMMDSLGNKNFGDMTQLFVVVGECQQNLSLTSEAAANFGKAYKLLRDWMASDSTGTDMPRAIIRLDNIGQYLLPKMKANVLAGRKDSALATGMRIIECFDSALTRQKNDAAAELATIYDTQGKERQIAEQQIRISRGRVLTLVVAIVTLTVFFVVFTILRHRAAKRLAKVTPAKEVGGDLYGYLHDGDSLYFTVGDVSGKGVPASLFMAQATRLFMSLARQGMKPAEICTLLNNELSGADNECACGWPETGMLSETKVPGVSRWERSQRTLQPHFL